MENLEFRKLTAEDVEARVQSADENGFMLLIYKNARVDQNILDETVGAFGWQNKYEEYKGNLYCSIGIKDNDGNFIWKSNCGTESNTEKEKGEASDAFKRAGFNWGIGRELYTSPKIKIKGHTIQRGSKYIPEYYSFEVEDLQVSDTKPRKIIALKIIGKSMLVGYKEEVIFDWHDNIQNKSQKTEEEIIGGAYVLKGGKYDGKTIQEVYDIDKNYCVYCSENARTYTMRANFLKCMKDNGYVPETNV